MKQPKGQKGLKKAIKKVERISANLGLQRPTLGELLAVTDVSVADYVDDAGDISYDEFIANPLIAIWCDMATRSIGLSQAQLWVEASAWRLEHEGQSLDSIYLTWLERPGMPMLGQFLQIPIMYRLDKLADAAAFANVLRLSSGCETSEYGNALSLAHEYLWARGFRWQIGPTVMSYNNHLLDGDDLDAEEDQSGSLSPIGRNAAQP